MVTRFGEVIYDLGAPPRRHPLWIPVGIVVLLGLGALLAWAPIPVSFVILGIIFWLLPFFSIELGFYTMIILLPIPEARLMIGESYNISFSSLVMISILLCLLSKRVIHRESVLGFEPRKLWPLWCFVVVHFASIAVSVDLPRSVNIFLHILIWVLLLLVTQQVIVNRHILRNALLLMIIEGVIITLIGYYDNFVHKVEISALYHYTGGVSSIYTNRNQYGNYLVAIIPLAVAFVLYGQRWETRITNLGAVFTLALSLITTLSRGAWVGCLFGLAVFMRNWRAWILALVAIMSIYYWAPENIKTRFRSIWDPRVKSANQSRMLIQASGLALFGRHPVLGVGTGCFEVAVGGARTSTRLPTNLSAHNTYLEMAAETGIIGFIAFVIFIGFVTNKIYKINIPQARAPDRLYRLALLSAWLSLLVHFLFITAFFNSMPWFLIGAILAANRILSSDEADLPTKIS